MVNAYLMPVTRDYFRAFETEIKEIGCPEAPFIMNSGGGIMTPQQALTIDFRSQNWAAPPYNGATAYRPDFDHWLASKATDAGAQLLHGEVVACLRFEPRARQPH